MDQQGKDDKKEPAFRVSDRRRFAGGERRVVSEEGAAKKDGGPQESQGREESQAEVRQEDMAKKDRRPPQELPPINFSTFVISLSSSALIHLGLIEDPVTGKIDRDLALARQNIDILGMLQEKTRGNLSEEESRLLESILFDLRIRFVEEAGKAGG